MEQLFFYQSMGISFYFYLILAINPLQNLGKGPTNPNAERDPILALTALYEYSFQNSNLAEESTRFEPTNE